MNLCQRHVHTRKESIAVPIYAVRVRTFELKAKDGFVYVDAPDEFAARIGVDKARTDLDPATHSLLKLIGDVTLMPGENVSPELIDVVVDRFGDEIGVEVL